MAQTPADAPEAIQIQMLKTAQSVKVDGVLDEECWEQATPIKADFTHFAKWPVYKLTPCAAAK